MQIDLTPIQAVAQRVEVIGRAVLCRAIAGRAAGVAEGGCLRHGIRRMGLGLMVARLAAQNTKN
jgi:hypothetical protein